MTWVLPWHREHLFEDVVTITTASQTALRLHIRRKSTILQSAANRTIYCSTSAKPRSWLLILERRRQTDTPLSTSVELRWSRWTVLGHHRDSVVALLLSETGGSLNSGAKFSPPFAEQPKITPWLETSQTSIGGARPQTGFAVQQNGD